MTLRTRILLLTTGPLVIVLAGVLLGMQAVARRELMARIETDLDNTGLAVQRDLASNQSRLMAEARVVGEEPRLKAVVTTPGVDRETRGDVAQELRGAIGWDLLGLADADGALGSFVGPPGISGAPPVVGAALEQGQAAGYWFAGGHLFQVVATRLAFGSKVVGVLLAGAELSKTRIADLTQETRSELAFFSNGQVVASSLGEAETAALTAWRDGKLPADVVLAEDDRYLTRTVKIDGAVQVAVLESAERALGPYHRLRHAVIGIGILALLLAVILATTLALRWSRPIAELLDLARSVKAGDLEARVKPSGGTELATLGSTLNEMVAEIARQRRRDELASFLVHDLKNPISGVLMNAQFIAETEELPKDVSGSVRDIVIAAQTMLTMVMDLLDVGRSSDGSLVPRKAVFDLHELVREVTHEAATRGARRKQSVVTALNGPRTIRADRELRRRVLENLADNALKYAGESGQIAIDVMESKAGRVELRVRDEGPGVPEAYRARIFDKYFRLERDAEAHKRVSVGLGLVFCRVATEAHEGRIWVEDNKPKGSAFCIDLPLGT